MDTLNSQGVSLGGDRIVVLFPKRSMTPDETLVFAAWLVAVAQPFSSLPFADALAREKGELRRSMTPDEAVAYAARLVAMSEDATSLQFSDVLEKILNS